MPVRTRRGRKYPIREERWCPDCGRSLIGNTPVTQGKSVCPTCGPPKNPKRKPIFRGYDKARNPVFREAGKDKHAFR